MSPARGFARGAALLAGAALVLAGCGTPALDDASEKRLADAQSEAAAAAEALDDLTARIGDLEDEISALSGGRDSLASKLEKISSRLDSALAKLGRQIDGVRESSSAAATAAGSALAEARAAARDISVLERRFDYHLKHGSG